MRNALTRFALWLCRKLDVNPIDQRRLSNGTDAVARGARWEAFYREEGGLADMLLAIRRESFEAAAATDPRETELIYYLATTDRIVRKLQHRIESVVASGKMDAAQIVQMDKIHAGYPLR